MTQPSQDDRLVFNGVDVDTGSYLLQPQTIDQIAAAALGLPLDPRRVEALRDRDSRGGPSVLAPVDGVDVRDLAQAGWGVIFPAGVDSGPLQEALAPLLELRRAQAGDRFFTYSGADAPRPDEAGLDWLAAHGGGPGSVDPEKIPYYLLIVGEPEQIPYSFQFDLDVQHAVGRICFDTLDEYHAYARSVAAAERREVLLPARFTAFGVENPGDRATQLSSANLVAPLFADLSRTTPLTSEIKHWQLGQVVGPDATKGALARLLGGDATPALLFTASHGAGFGDFSTAAQAERQRRLQGALVTAEWPGPGTFQPVGEAQMFAGHDVAADARVLGTIVFMFACYGAGTPLLDEFAHQRGASARPEPIAPRPFVARLPQRLLGHPRGGALAVLGHVERATGYSFAWPGNNAQTQDFRSAIQRIMRGWPVGSALEFFNMRYAQLGAELSAQQARYIRNEPIKPLVLSRIWTASNDARGYVIFGDPAVRAAVAPDGQARAHALEPAALSGAPAAPEPAAMPDQPASPAPAGAEQPSAEAAPGQPAAAPASDAAAAASEPAAASGEPTQPAARRTPPAAEPQPRAASGSRAQGAPSAAPAQDIRIDLGAGGSLNLRLEVSVPPRGGAALGGSGDPGDVEFGVLDRVLGREPAAAQGEAPGATDTLRERLAEFAKTVADKLGDFVEEATTLEVRTYVSSDLNSVELKEGKLPGVAPRAVTFIQLDGDTVVVVPEAEGEIDVGLWKIHTDMVAQAQATRAEMLRTLLAAATGLLNVK